MNFDSNNKWKSPISHTLSTKLSRKPDTSGPNSLTSRRRRNTRIHKPSEQNSQHSTPKCSKNSNSNYKPSLKTKWHHLNSPNNSESLKSLMSRIDSSSYSPSWRARSCISSRNYRTSILAIRTHWTSWVRRRVGSWTSCGLRSRSSCAWGCRAIGRV